MLLLQYPQLMFRVFGILPLDGVDFNTHKCLEILRMCLLPVPTYVTGITFVAYSVINFSEVVKVTDALFGAMGFMNAALIYTLLMYRKQQLLDLMNDLQILLDQSKAKNYWSQGLSALKRIHIYV